MPVYSELATVSKPTLDGAVVTVWSNQVVPARAAASPPEASASLQVGLRRNTGFPTCLSAEVKFASAPGAFEVEVQTADTDDDDYYVVKGSITAVNSAFAGRLELTNVVARFARLSMKTLTNAVAVTGRLS